MNFKKVCILTKKYNVLKALSPPILYCQSRKRPPWWAKAIPSIFQDSTKSPSGRSFKLRELGAKPGY